ncbi:ATP-grasp domain-containing protein [Streptomyces bacillaris]|uniref:ATP-grasp domain-containing protein n=1 Tax=Streptomyces bacillaris TaxID=68179 RepID=UPI0035DE5667
MADLLVFVESNTTGTGRLFAERARALGLEPHVLCADPARYPYLAELAIPHHRCATGDPEAVLTLCRALADEHRVHGVTSSSEYFIANAAATARALGLPGPDPRALAATRDKSVQRQLFAEHGVPSPAFRTAGSPAEAARAATELGLPVVVKPPGRSGSIGVRRCDTPEAVTRHTAALLATTMDERGLPLPATVLVESYLDGPEFSVEVFDGRVRAVIGKHLDQGLGFLETGHDVPAPVDDAVRAELGTAALAALAALGLGWGAAHVELRLVDGRAVVVEVNPRLAGGMIPQAVLAATGQDLIAELIALVAGRTPVRGPERTDSAAIRFVVPVTDGEVSTVPDPASARGLPGVVDAAVSARGGQRITRQGTFLDRLGHVVAVGSSLREAADRADRAVRTLSVGVSPLVPSDVTTGPDRTVPSRETTAPKGGYHE